MIVSGDEVGLWVADRLGFGWTDQQTAIGEILSGTIKAGCIFESYIPDRSVIAHWAIDKASRGFFLACFGYVFKQLNVNCVIGFVDSENTRAINLNTRLGFSQCGIIPDAGKGGDLVIMQCDTAAYLRFEEKYEQR